MQTANLSKSDSRKIWHRLRLVELQPKLKVLYQNMLILSIDL